MKNLTNNSGRTLSAVPQISARKKLLFSLVSIIGFFVVVETASFSIFAVRGDLSGDLKFHPILRDKKNVYDPGFTESYFAYDPYLSYRFKPGAVIENPDKTSYRKINSQGFIGNGNIFPELDQKPKNKKRIIIFGGSTVAGGGVSANKYTIPANIEKILNSSKNENYEVINAGVDGYTAFLEMAYYQSGLFRYRPDILVFYDGYNDYSYATYAGGYLDNYQKECCWANYHRYALYLLASIHRLDKERPPEFLVSLLNKTYTTILIKKIYYRLGGRQWYGDDVIQSIDIGTRTFLIPKEAADRYASFMENTITSTSGGNRKVLYAFQPSILNKKNISEEEQKVFQKRHTVSPKTDGPQKIRAYYQHVSDHYERLSKKYNNENILIADLSNDIWGEIEETAYLDEVHTNDFGNSIIAKKLAGLIKKLGKS